MRAVSGLWTGADQRKPSKQITTMKIFTPFRNSEFIKPAVLVATLGILLAAMSGRAWAGKKTIPFEDARIRIEVNATDGDSGLHILLDADEGWRWVHIFDPKGRMIFHVAGGGSIRKTGLTELFLESAEPGFDELPLDEFLKRFPEGEYRLVGKTIEGNTLSGKATLTHAIPDGPVILGPANGSVQNPSSTVISWQPVPDPAGSQIVRYEVIVTQEDPAPPRVLDAVLPATVHSMTVPSAFLLPGGIEYKFEVLAIEAGGNQTLSESAFVTSP
jgi:Fibronectin type III domain